MMHLLSKICVGLKFGHEPYRITMTNKFIMLEIIFNYPKCFKNVLSLIYCKGYACNMVNVFLTLGPPDVPVFWDCQGFDLTVNFTIHPIILQIYSGACITKCCS